jgi:DNA-binding response OmpR family regulator
MATHSDNAVSPESADRPVVMVAEDDGQISFLLQLMLEREGYRVLLAHDGQQAKRLVDEITPPRLVMLDIMMPYADGFEVLAHLRAKPEWRDTPVLMLTARSQEQDIERALDAGAADYVVKPFLPQELIAKIRHLLLQH